MGNKIGCVILALVVAILSGCLPRPSNTEFIAEMRFACPACLPGQTNVGFAPLKVAFLAVKPLDAVITWDFGDGTTDQGYVTTHTFIEPGTYIVTMTATKASPLGKVLTATAMAGFTVLAQPASPINVFSQANEFLSCVLILPRSLPLGEIARMVVVCEAKVDLEYIHIGVDIPDGLLPMQQDLEKMVLQVPRGGVVSFTLSARALRTGTHIIVATAKSAAKMLSPTDITIRAPIEGVP